MLNPVRDERGGTSRGGKRKHPCVTAVLRVGMRGWSVLGNVHLVGSGVYGSLSSRRAG